MIKLPIYAVQRSLKTGKRLCPILFIPLFFGAPAIEAAPFVEQNGVVVMEVESTPAVGSWQSRTTIAGYSGTAYYHPTANKTAAGGSDILAYPFTTSGAGIFQIQIRSRIAEGTSFTDCNDCWIRLVDSKNQVVNLVANSNTVSANGWLKFYQNKLNVWTWQTSNKDNDPKSMSWDLTAKTGYTFQISMRSAGHAVDKIVMWNKSSKNLGDSKGMVSGAQDTELNALPLSQTGTTSAVNFAKADKGSFAIHRIGDGTIQIVNPFSTPFSIQMLTMSGQVIRQEQGLDQSVYNIDISNRASGLVVFKVSNGSHTYSQKKTIK